MQSNYLKEQKQNLDNKTALILMDFSENYTFTVQNEVQGYNWNHGYCTLHTAVIYYLVDNILKSKSVCVISNDLNHDVPMVFKTQQLLLNYIKSDISSHITSVPYFTDGWAAQYKNCKNFINLCYHMQDFLISVEWSFFATSHGKSPCDGVGAVVKRPTTKASLQRFYDDQIMSATQMYNFCKEHKRNNILLCKPRTDVKITRRSC